MPSTHSFGYFGSIDYNEPDQKTYRGIKVSDNMTPVKEFNTGDPVLDYIDLIMWLSDEESGIRWSSSFDHFLMDGDLYVEKYVTCNKSDDPSKFEYVEDFEKIDAGDYDFRVISNGFKTFQEHRAYLKNKRNG